MQERVPEFIKQPITRNQKPRPMATGAQWFDLTGRVALVTGGSKGLGRTIADALARAGADGAIASRTQAELERSAAALRQHGHRVAAVRADVTDEASVQQMVQQVIDGLGQIDILVNNAGIGESQSVVDMDT